MTLGVVVLVALVACGWLARRERLHGAVPPARWERASSSRLSWCIAWATVALAHAPYLREVASYVGPRALMWSDQFSHAAVGQALAKGALAHGWIDTYNGGFPFGPHYPSVGWLTIAGLVVLGVPASQAVKLLGVASTLAVPAVVLFLARRLGMRPAAAALGTIALSTVTPYTSFVGGWGTFLTIGLVSQSLAMPIVIAWVFSLFDRRALAPALAALAVAAHPQIFTPAAIVVLVTAVVAFDARARAAVMRSFIAAAALGVALYGPGVATLHTPFGWPPMEPWRTVGYGAGRLADWFGDGDLLDWERPPIFTYAWIVAMVVVVARAHVSRVCRGVAVAAVVTLFLAVCGRWYVHAGALGAFLATFLQPMRALALVPVAAAATIAVALQELGAVAIAVSAERGSLLAAHAARAAPWVATVGFALTVFPSNARFASTLRAVQDEEWRGACRERVPGFDAPTLAGWVAHLDRGRVAFDEGDHLEHCPALFGVELASAVPLSESLGAGAHVGVACVAFQALRPAARDSAMRAESLGIRTIIHRASRKLTPDDAWRTIATRGEVEMSERVGGTDVVGVGCVSHRWSGSDAALRDALFADLVGDAHVLEDPRALTELVTTSGPVVREDIAHDDCDARAADVREIKREPGVYEATVLATSDVDVVFRASAFPTWRVVVDGVRATVKVVAPGWFAVRVRAGAHHVIAEVSPLRGYAAGIVLALVVVLLVSTGALGRARKALANRAARSEGT